VSGLDTAMPHLMLLRPFHEKADLVKANLVAHSVVLLPLRHGLASIRTVTGRLSVTPCMLESV